MMSVLICLMVFSGAATPAHLRVLIEWSNLLNGAILIFFS
jgi:hypothetical protein